MEGQKNSNGMQQNNLLFNSPNSHSSPSTTQIKEESSMNLYKLVTSPSSVQFSPGNILMQKNHPSSTNFYNQSILNEQQQLALQQQQQLEQNSNINRLEPNLDDVKSLDEILSQNDPLLSNSVLYSENLMESFGWKFLIKLFL